MNARDLFVGLLNEAQEKLDRYCSSPSLGLSRPYVGENDLAVLRSLLAEAVERIDATARKQGARRMAGRWLCDGTLPNPNRGSHYPAVQSFLDRARQAIGARRTVLQQAGPR